MEDCPKPCINNDYAEKTKLFNILETENDYEWNQLISKLVNNPIVKNNLISTSEHDLQFKWSYADKTLVMITQIDTLYQTAIQTVENKNRAWGFEKTTNTIELDMFNFIGPWFSDCDKLRPDTIGCIDELINPREDGVELEVLITRYVDSYVDQLTNVLQYMLKKIDEISGSKDKSDSHDYFILIRNIPGLKKGASLDLQDAKLVAESWHKDYLWAPAEFSSIIYYKNLILKDDIINYPPDIYDETEIVAAKLSNQQKLEIIKFRGNENWEEDTNISTADFCLTPLFINEVGLNYFFNQEEIGNYFRDLFFEFIKQDVIQKLQSRSYDPTVGSGLIPLIETKEYYDTEVQNELSKIDVVSKFKLEDNIFNETGSLLNDIFKDLDHLKSNLEKILITPESIDNMASFIELKPSITVSTSPSFKGTILRFEREEEGNKMYEVLNNSTGEIVLIREKDITLTPIDLIDAIKNYYTYHTKVIKISTNEDTIDDFIITDYSNSTIISNPIFNNQEDDQIIDSIKMIQTGFKSFSKTIILQNIFNLPKKYDILDNKLCNKIIANLQSAKDKEIFNSIKDKLSPNDKNAIYYFINEFIYLINFIHFINIYFLKIISKKHGYFDELNIHIRQIRQNILYINVLIPSYDYEHQTESSEEYIKLPEAITNRGELLIAVKKKDDFLKTRDNWLKGRILFFSKDHLYIRLEEYVIDDSRRTIYIEDDEELIYLDKSWIPKVNQTLKKYCPYPSNNACVKLNWSDFSKTWKIPLANLNPAKIATPWYSGPDVFNQDLANFIAEGDERGPKQIVRKSKINIASKINLEAENRFAQKMAIEKRTGDIDDNYRLRNNKKNIYKNSVGCSPHKYYIPKVKLNDALIWDNQNTVHRSPFMESSKTVIRSFLNIRFLKKDEYRPHPYVSKDMDMSQLIA